MVSTSPACESGYLCRVYLSFSLCFSRGLIPRKLDLYFVIQPHSPLKKERSMQEWKWLDLSWVHTVYHPRLGSEGAHGRGQPKPNSSSAGLDFVLGPMRWPIIIGWVWAYIFKFPTCSDIFKRKRCMCIVHGMSLPEIEKGLYLGLK